MTQNLLQTVNLKEDKALAGEILAFAFGEAEENKGPNRGFQFIHLSLKNCGAEIPEYVFGITLKNIFNPDSSSVKKVVINNLLSLEEAEKVFEDLKKLKAPYNVAVVGKEKSGKGIVIQVNKNVIGDNFSY